MARGLALCVLAGSLAGAVAAATGASAPPSRERQADAAVRAFIGAFNRHDVKAALGFLASDPQVAANDCDFARGRTVAYRRRADVARWLRERSADRDRLTLAGVRLLGSLPAGAAVTYSLRRSGTLSGLGYGEGIVPNGSKVGFTTTGRVRITQFANAAGSGRACGPTWTATSPQPRVPRFEPPGRRDCSPPSPAPAVTDLREARGTVDRGDLFALFFPPTGSRLASETAAAFDGLAGKEMKIVWRMVGTGDIRFAAHGPDGEAGRLTFGPTRHTGSSWHRPGEEWGTGFVFPRAGCWQVHVSRGDASGDLWLDVRS